jgi:muramoyltetrapeptide carboxypeptidase
LFWQNKIWFLKKIYFYKKISMTVTPDYIKKGDAIGIVSPAGFVRKSIIDNAAAIVKRLGYRAEIGKHALEKHHQFAGTDSERTADMQRMLDDDSIRMILCARGGYGMIRIIDRLDFGRFLKQPKWIAGYSDITVLQSHLLSTYGVESLHGIMPLNFSAKGIITTSVEQLFKTASGEIPDYHIPTHPLNRNGDAKGRLVGGNLAILVSLTSSRSDVSTDGKILFIEEVGEALYRLDRMMYSLKRAGKLSQLAGLVVGGLTDMTDSDAGFGKKAEEIVAEAIDGYNYPVCFGFPAGHIPDNFPLIIGRETTLHVKDQSVKLSFLQ